MKLSFEVLVDEAQEMALSEGVEALSMRRLADRCGVGAMTIYGYIASKEDLLSALADRFLSEIEPPDPADPWQEQLADLFGSVRQVMLAHPALVPIMATQRIDGPSAYRGAEIVFAALRDVGLADLDVLASFTVLTSFTVGCVQREVGVRSAEDRALPALAALPADEFPNVVSLSEGIASREPEWEFHEGLRMIIDGIATRVGQ